MERLKLKAGDRVVLGSEPTRLPGFHHIATVSPGFVPAFFHQNLWPKSRSGVYIDGGRGPQTGKEGEI
jgi:hypothetical protein